MSKAKVPPGWRALGGSARRYIDPEGHEVSREEFLKRTKPGFISFKKATAAVPEEIRKSRPARGRGKKAQGPDFLSRAEPFVGKRSRTEEYTFYLFYNGDPDNFMADIEQYRGMYTEILLNLAGNKKIIAAGLRVQYSNKGKGAINAIKTLSVAEAPKSLAANLDFDKFASLLLEKAYSEDDFSKLLVFIAFQEKFLKTDKRKKKRLKIRRKPKA